MSINPYFSQAVRSEQSLYEDIVIESLKIYGQDVYYLPRDIVNKDTILNEDVPSSFNSSHKIEMYIENVEGFDGEGDLFTKFGVEIRDAATFIVSRKRWANVVGQMNNEIESIRPREGDLIYLTLTNKLFEIMHVEHEQPFYQLSNLPTFKLRCELFTYSDERLNTSIDAIDDIEKSGYNLKLLMNQGIDSINSNISYDFMEGEFVQQTLAGGKIITAEVLEYNQSQNYIVVSHVSTSDGTYGMFVPGVVQNTRLRNISGALAYIGDSATTVYRTLTTIDENVYGDSSFAQNDIFDTSENTFDLDFLDFSENNPFGDPEDL